MKKGYGWIMFAAIMLMIAGLANFFWGITALAYSTYLVNQLLFTGLGTWGWLTIIFGIIQIIAGASVLNKSQWARWFGIITGALGVMIMFFVLWAHPVWSVVVIALDVLVIYGLAQYGGEEA